MATLIVPPLDLSIPTLGPAVCDLIESKFVFGPGSLAGLPAVLDAEKRAIVYRLYEVYPQGHRNAGRRIYQRGGIELKKGVAKTELGVWVTGAELHPEGPVRCDGFDSRGNPVGRPVKFPYIPMMATTEEQVSELAYYVLTYVLEHSPDADLFDISLERVLRKGPDGKVDGKALPVSTAPDSADGALTTFQHFDEPHRLDSPRQRQAHETMTQNLHKRAMEDPWSLYTSTAGQLGANSVQEDVRAEAELIDAGEREEPSLFFFARWAGDSHDDLTTVEKRIAAVAEATGPIGEYGPGQFERIAKDYDRPGMDRAYWERTQLNRWRRGGSQFFDMKQIYPLCRPGVTIESGAFVTLGFDGARFRDATGLVATDIGTGLQELLGLWERPDKVESWEVPEDEVTALVDDAMTRFEVWKLYADPPHWTETVGSWSAKWPDRVEEFWTKQYSRMAYTLRDYLDAIGSGTVAFGGTDIDGADFLPHSDLLRHLANAGIHELRIKDDEGKPLHVMQKQDGKAELKFDAGMAAVLSWKARLDAIKAGAKPRRRQRRGPRRLY